jgi:hypothetical protein
MKEKFTTLHNREYRYNAHYTASVTGAVLGEIDKAVVIRWNVALIREDQWRYHQPLWWW